MDKADRDKLKKMARFVVDHSSCAGDIVFIEPAEDQGVTSVSQTKMGMRCPGCGKSLKADVDISEVLAEMANEMGIESKKLNGTAQSQLAKEDLAERRGAALTAYLLKIHVDDMDELT
jgi:hypothetical protein